MDFKILFVEDDVELLNLLVDTLSLYFKINAIVAYNGEDGFEQYLIHKPDLIISDLNLPGMCGLEMIEKIREIDNIVKIMVLTGFGETDRLIRATTVGLCGFFLKPIKLQDIINKIETIISDASKWGGGRRGVNYTKNR